MEFEDEVSASMALTKTDGTKFNDRVLTVALSNPPPRQDKASSAREDRTELTKDMLGGGSRSRRTQLSFVPNAVQLRNKPKSGQHPNPAVGSVVHPPQKSNSDFRALLNNK